MCPAGTLSDNILNKISEKCNNFYSSLPKTGKPIETEWTVLSCVIQRDTESDDLQIVSLGTGSKCIGSSKMTPSGYVLNDSHAEVVARRGFIHYIYHQISLAADGKESIFIRSNKKFQLRDNFSFIFYSSQLPCGDASIIPKTEDNELFGDVIMPLKRKAAETMIDKEAKMAKKVDDIHRTGAKCLPNVEQDPKNEGANYHICGKVRTKPGRGDRTLSVSCSDKMARWIKMGIQGNLLYLLLTKPIYIKHFVFGANVPYSIDSLERGLLSRGNEHIITNNMPSFQQSSVMFPQIKSISLTRPAPASIVWIKDINPVLEVAVHGYKLGTTKKKINTLSSSLCISKYNLFKKFVEVVNKCTELKLTITNVPLETIPYNKMKKINVQYLKQWDLIKQDFFKMWTVKPDIWNFTLSNVNS